MKVTIDKAGRIVIPKPIRDRMGVDAGTHLEIEERAEGLLIRPTTHESAVVERNGLLVHTGKPPADFQWQDFLADEHDRRLREVSGL
jgi:AbrB family looped-hinge helix DNA binding protein